MSLRNKKPIISQMDVFVARQPIFDRDSNVYAYELLYRSNAASSQFNGTDEDSTTLEVIAGSLLNIGLKSIAGGKKAFINFGRNLLVDGLVTMLPKESIVIEILETTEPDEQVIETCRHLRNLGYTIALDDFEWSPRFDPLIEIAHLIKVDLRLTSRQEQERMVSTYRSRGIEMLAEKVETHEEFQWARGLGYDYFQGYFFARPATLSAKDIQPSVITCLQLLRDLQNPEIDFKKVEELVSKDLGLAYKLFKYVNSVLLSHQGQIQSIRRALVQLGEDGIRRWVTIATLPRLGKGKSDELVTCALVRARFSENLARIAGDPNTSSAYLVGLFSVLDALLDRPLEEALGEVGLESRIRDVLLGSAPENDKLVGIYRLIRSYEAGDWDRARTLASNLGLNDSAVSSAYVDSTEWASQILSGQDTPGSNKSAAAPQGPKGKERRRFKREPLTASISIMWGERASEEHIAQAQLVDISVKGARFRVAMRVPQGSWLMFNHHKMGISGRGSVRHCRMVKGAYEVGVEFSSGTGWDAVSDRFGSHLRNLGGAIDRLQTEQSSAPGKP
jgi:c-di-GMP-related signal transduction protein